MRHIRYPPILGNNIYKRSHKRAVYMRVIYLPAAPDITETKGFTKLKRNE